MKRRGRITGAAATLAALSLTGFTTAGISSSPATPSPTTPEAGGFNNTGATHSPRLLQELAGPLSKTGMPAIAGTSYLRGVDVADYQHPNGASINWRQVAAAGYKFAAVKATEGTYYINPWAARDVIAGRNAGLYMTYYAFAIPNDGGGAAQADYLLAHSHWSADGRMLPPELDIEYDPYSYNECYGLSQRNMVHWIAEFSTEIEHKTGEWPIIYTTADWWSTCTGGNRIFGPNNPLWVAAYGVGSPPLPSGWRTWTFWQYSSTGSVPGIQAPGDTDVSYFNGGQVKLIDPGSQTATVGRRVSLQVHSLNAEARQTLRYTAKGLPPGLSVGGQGQITGTTADPAGTYRVTVSAQNGSGHADSVSFNWQVHG
jgi:GH25 family lysozyme M1 (1,4-beta-N-acetylmuramidase)